MSVYFKLVNKKASLTPCLSGIDGRGVTQRMFATITHCTLLNTLLECTDKSAVKKPNRFFI